MPRSLRRRTFAPGARRPTPAHYALIALTVVVGLGSLALVVLALAG